MQTQIKEDDLKLVKAMWRKRQDIMTNAYLLRRQFLDAERHLTSKLDELENDLQNLVQSLKVQNAVPEGWKLDIADGTFKENLVEEEV